MNKRKLNLMKLTVFAVMLIMLVSGCTRKDNPTGDNWSDITPLIAIDSTFSMGYSYTHDGKVLGTETSLLTGSEAGIEAVSFIRYTGLPDTTYTFVEQPVLKLVAFKRSPLRRDPLILTFHKLNTTWTADSTSNISDADITALPIPNYAVQDTISTEGDTLSANIDGGIIQNWASGDTTGFNLVIKTIGNSWLEYKSRESGNGPLLSFKYVITGTTDTLSYSQRPVLDSYRITGEQALLAENVWKLKNLLPMRMFVKNGLSETIFVDKDGNQLSSQDMKRMTINRAELVMHIKNNPYYANSRCYFYPYRVAADTLINPVVLTDSQLESITHSYSSTSVIDADSVKIDITAITQAFTSGDKENYGMVIKNTTEMFNFGNLEFWHFADAPAGKKPYVRIYYTVPYLK